MLKTHDDKVFTCGTNDFGELGLGHRENTYYLTEIEDLTGKEVSKISCCLYSAALTKRGELFIWGTSPQGESIRPQKLKVSQKPLVDIKIGVRLALAQDELGKVWAWGQNDNFELGLGNNSKQEKAKEIRSLANKSVRGFAIG